MKSVLLADDNRNWLDVLEIGINRDESFHVVAKTYDGRETIAKIEVLRPDILVLDIIMPEYDGVYIVNHIRQTMPDYHPAIYILSGIGTDTVIKILNDLHVDYYSMKPVSIEIVLDALKKIGRCQQLDGMISAGLSGTKDPYRLVSELVHALGMPLHLISTKCVIESLVVYLGKPGRTFMLTKELYPEIATVLSISKSSVEKNIRAAIAQMQKKHTETYARIFLYAGSSQREACKLTNGEFLSLATEYLKRATYSETGYGKASGEQYTNPK